MEKQEFGQGRTDLVDIFGPLVDLSDPASAGTDYAAIRSIVPAGATVPLHSHVDRETIVLTKGRLDVWLRGSWSTHDVGEVVDLPSNEKHALRNASGGDVHLVMVTTPRMVRFFKEVSAPFGTEVSPERLAHFFSTAGAYGYWNGGPEDQAEIGILMPGDGDRATPLPAGLA